MEKEQNKANIDLRFANINVIKFSQFDLRKPFKKDVFPLIEFITKIEFRVLELEKRLSCLITVEMKLIETEEDFAEMKLETQFDVNPFSAIIKVDSINFQIPNALMQTVASVSISTLRGVLYEKLKGTIAQNDIYPLMNLAQFFPSIEK